MNNYVCIFTRALSCSSLKILQYVTIPFEFVLDTLVPFWALEEEEDERSLVDFRYRHRRNPYLIRTYVCTIHIVQARAALPPNPRALLISSVLLDIGRFHVSPEIHQQLRRRRNRVTGKQGGKSDELTPKQTHGTVSTNGERDESCSLLKVARQCLQLRN